MLCDAKKLHKTNNFFSYLSNLTGYFKGCNILSVLDRVNYNYFSIVVCGKHSLVFRRKRN